MKKIEMMDTYFNSNQNNINSSDICRVVNSIFNIDLENIPIFSKEIEKMIDAPLSIGEKSISRFAIDWYLNKCQKVTAGIQIRNILKQIFGINLDAISSLEGARISLFSKNQWILKHEKDLFVVHTGIDDVDVKIYPTNYFTEQTGLIELPDDLKHSLSCIGYNYEEKIGLFYYIDPKGEAVPDSFKGKTIGAILKVINQSFSNL